MDAERTIPAELGTRNGKLVPADAAEAPATVGRYRILEARGVGGAGTVYAAYDPELDRRVAVKLLHRQGQDANETLLSEAKALARLSHPNVLTVHDVGTADGRVFVAMEFVDGPALNQWLMTLPRPLDDASRRRVIEVMVGAGRGLASAHEAGLVHRDFKPHNVLLSAGDRPRVADFGLAQPSGLPAGVDDTSRAKSRSGRSRRGGFGITGTPAYMAPEVLAGEPAETHSDQFSFCVALFEALHGVRPFQGDTVASLAYTIAHGDPVEPEGTNVPHWLHQHVLRGLSRDPGQRWESMEALVDALERDLHARRRRWLLGGGLTFGLVGLGAFLGARLQAKPEPCRQGAQRFAEVWHPARAERIEGAFGTTNLVIAAETAAAVTQRLDERAQRWVEMYQDACMLHRAGEQSDAMLDRRMACLASNRVQIDELVTLLEDADQAAIPRAVDAVDGIPPVARCGDLVALASDVAPPPEKYRDRIAVLEQRVAKLRSEISLGVVSNLSSTARSLAEDADAIGYAPLSARVYSELGLAAQQDGDYADASDALERAWSLGLQANVDDDLAATVLIDLTMLYGYHQQRFDLALARSRDAEAKIARVEQRDEEQAQLHRGRLALSLGLIKWRKKDLEGARTDLERSQRLLSKVLPPNHAQLAQLYNAMGMVLQSNAAPKQAAEYYAKALQIQTARYPEAHPGVITLRNNLGVLYRNTFEDEAAIEQHTKAYESLNSYEEPPAALMAMVALNLGASLVRAKRWEDALDVMDPILHLDHVDPQDENTPPDRIQAYAMALEQVGRIDEAVDAQLRAVEAATRQRDTFRAGRTAMGLVELLQRLEQPVPVAPLQRAVELIDERTPPSHAEQLHAALSAATGN